MPNETRKTIARAKTTPETRKKIADAAPKFFCNFGPVGGDEDTAESDELTGEPDNIGQLLANIGLSPDDFEDGEDGGDEAELIDEANERRDSVLG